MTNAQFTSSDPLSSWNEGAVKQSIINFVTRITTEGSPDFVPVEARIATFDNDGTLGGAANLHPGVVCVGKARGYGSEQSVITGEAAL